MKLYTEEQVRDMLEDMNYLSLRGIDYYMSEMTPIELPSDEDIIAKSKQEPDNSDIETAARIGYIAGVKWMRDKILNK